ncbi:MAG: hypothetical protein LKJ88_03390 [Bacilli bacterium]|jgi:hypothetical protein|nr:hypothetical protein [Bacilli bacterium]
MKKAGQIIVFIAGLLFLVLGAVFAFIEGRLLFSLDYKLYADPVFGFFSAFFRFLASLMFLSEGILSLFIFSKKEHPLISIYLYIFSIACCILGAIITFTILGRDGPTPFYLSWPFFLISLLHFIGATLFFLKATEENKVAYKAK